MSLEELTNEELSRLSTVIGDDVYLSRVQRAIGAELEARDAFERGCESHSHMKLRALQIEQARIDREISRLLKR